MKTKEASVKFLTNKELVKITLSSLEQIEGFAEELDSNHWNGGEHEYYTKLIGKNSRLCIKNLKSLLEKI